MQTPDGFRSLASLLVPRTHSVEEPAVRVIEDEIEFTAERDDAEVELARSVRLFHARVKEALDAAAEVLLTDIAAEVLARELLLAPPDIEAIVQGALTRYANCKPLRVRVHPEDAAQLACGVPVIADETLRRGDALVELRDGSLDASLGVRLENVLKAAAG